jgi:hypothetical protein
MVWNFTGTQTTSPHHCTYASISAKVRKCMDEQQKARRVHAAGSSGRLDRNFSYGLPSAHGPAVSSPPPCSRRKQLLAPGARMAGKWHSSRRERLRIPVVREAAIRTEA